MYFLQNLLKEECAQVTSQEKDTISNSNNVSKMDFHDATNSLLYHQEHYIIKDVILIYLKYS